jgi:pectin methylesterase-like acyl-CoA thioesterase
MIDRSHMHVKHVVLLDGRAAASGFGFMMRDMTVENRAGPARHQAVALRVSADRAVVHRCSIAGYQDTLYAHSNRQFYRDCDVYGTVDFVFGNAAAVLQRCNLWARVPLPGQKNTVTAQSRNESCQRTGLVLHACRLLAAPAAQGPTAATASPAPAPAPDQAPPTYLGRPWKPFSRVVVMLSYIGPHVPPQGWLEWNATSTYALDRLYFGEYMNYGPGAGLAGRVPWPGHRVINSTAEAERFTVARFIDGASWLPATGVSFDAGMSLL